MKKIFMMFLLTGAVLTANAQSTLKVHGAVIDKKNGNPLPGAKVEATGGAESTVTDADGTFTLEVSKWLKSLTATYPGMNMKKEKIDGGVHLLFELTPKQKLTWFVNLVGNATYFEPRGPVHWTPGLGLMFGQVGKWGWYGKFMCDFKGPQTVTRSNYRLDEGGSSDGLIYWNKEGNYISDYSYSSTSSYQTVYYDEKEENIKPGLTFTIGGIKSIVPQVFYGFLGAGYSTGYTRDHNNGEFTASFVDSEGVRRTATYQDYVNYMSFTDPGLAFEGGFIVRVKHFNAMLGYTLRLGAKHWDATHTINLGVGYVF